QSDETLQAMGRAPLRGDTKLVSIDIGTLEQTTIATRPGIKTFPSVLNDGEIAYIRKDTDDRGIYYNSSGKPGARGILRSPSWSPDGKRVVYHRLLDLKVPSWQKAWSRNPSYNLAVTSFFSAFDPSGKRLAATYDDSSKLIQIETGQNTARTLFSEEGKLAESADWSPQGDAILF